METVNTWLSGKHDKTSVFIAHRLSTIANCDLIYVLDKGRVVEKGTHKELLQLGGLYSEMWYAQSHMAQ